MHYKANIYFFGTSTNQKKKYFRKTWTLARDICNPVQNVCMHKERWQKCQPPEADPCRNPGLNQGPLDLQSNALPTELFRLTFKSIL